MNCVNFFGSNQCRICLAPGTVKELSSLLEGDPEKLKIFERSVDLNIRKEKGRFKALTCNECFGKVNAAFQLITNAVQFDEDYFVNIELQLFSKQSWNFGPLVCRCCLSPGEIVSLTPMAGNVTKMWHFVTGLKVNSPSFHCKAVVCENCTRDLHQAAALKVQAQLSDLAIFEKVRKEQKRSKQQCGTCLEEFGSQRKLKEHNENVHLKIKRYSCDHCDYCVSYIQQLKHHLLFRHFKGIQGKAECDAVECSVCMKFSGTRSAVNSHLRRCHLMVAKLICDLCGQKSKKKQELKHHMIAKHTSDRNLSCSTEGCQQRFKSMRSLKIHVKTHDGTRKFVCWCKKKFTRKDNLTRHKKKRHH